MRLCIQNAKLSVIADTLGGELQSLRDGDGREYLWQGDARYWTGKAPNLFPYIARLTDGKYRYGGREYTMGIHGFICASELKPVLVQSERMVLQFIPDDKTKEIYPFDFVYEIEYRLQDNELDIIYRIRNTGDRRMYFGIGGHPGFQVPLDEDGAFEDYELKFERACSPEQIIFSEDCFVTGAVKSFPLEENGIRLRHGLFDHDAIVLKHMADAVTLTSGQSGRYVKIRYPQMKYLGIWHTPRSEAPYVCIEPWSSLPSRQGIIEDLEKQEDLVSVEENGVYHNQWSISCGRK